MALPRRLLIAHRPLPFKSRELTGPAGKVMYFSTISNSTLIGMVPRLMVANTSIYTVGGKPSGISAVSSIQYRRVAVIPMAKMLYTFSASVLAPLSTMSKLDLPYHTNKRTDQLFFASNNNTIHSIWPVALNPLHSGGRHP